MKILLTGACGRLARGIRKVGGGEHEFVLMDVVETVKAEGGICASTVDREAMLRAAEGCDAIIHTAAMHGGFRKTHDDFAFTQSNLLSAQNLFDAALKHGIRRLVMSSTMEVVIGRRWNASGRAVVVDENTTPQPDWIYPVNKLQIEILSRYYAEHHGLNVVQLRYMSIESDPAPLRLLARGIHTDDVARSNLLSLTRPTMPYAMLHIGPDSPLSREDVDQAMEDPWPVLERHWPGCRPILEAHGYAPKPNDFWPVTRIHLAAEMIGWRPQVTFASRLREMGWRE